jgi:hypothetical protein
VLASPFGLPPEHPSFPFTFPNTSLRNKPTFEIPCQVGRRQDKNAYCERKSAYGDISTLFLYMHILDHSATRVILHMSQRHDKIAAGKPTKKIGIMPLLRGWYRWRACGRPRAWWAGPCSPPPRTPSLPCTGRRSAPPASGGGLPRRAPPPCPGAPLSPSAPSGLCPRRRRSYRPGGAP